MFVPSEDPNPVTLNPEILAEAMAAWAWVSLTLATIIALTITTAGNLTSTALRQIFCPPPDLALPDFQTFPNQTIGEAEEEGCGGVKSTG